MSEGMLAEWMKAGYPHFREALGFQPWFLPEHQMMALTEEVGDEGAVRLGGSLLPVAPVLEELGKHSQPGALGAEVWEKGISSWGATNEVAVGAEGLVIAGEKLRALVREGKLGLKGEQTCRHLAVLLFAPVVASGKEVAKKLATVLGATTVEPRVLIERYMQHLAEGDTGVAEAVESCIEGDERWRQWATELLKYAGEFPFIPRVIGVTPPLSSVIMDGFTMMIEEGQNDRPERDSSEGEGKQGQAG